MLAPDTAPPAPLDSGDAARLRATLAPVEEDPAGFSREFFARLFQASPGLRHLFPADMRGQHRKFAESLRVIVETADEPERLLPRLRALGEAHRGYGAKSLHYVAVGEALLQSLAARNGPDFEGEPRAAWQRLYAWVAQVMQAGARQ